MHKGQFFIIGAILIVIAVITFKGLVSAYNTIDLFQLEKSDTSDKKLENIINEYKQITFSSKTKEKTLQSLYSFADFIYEDKIKSFYVFIYRNETIDEYEITMGNFLGNDINVLVYATSSTPEFVELLIKNKNYTTTKFFVSQGQVNLTIMHKLLSEDNYTIERISFDSQRNTTIGLFSVFSDENLFLNKKDIYISSTKMLVERPEEYQPSVCGNGICELGEDENNCPQDCNNLCGNGICDTNENLITCPADCGAYCGNGICDPGENENNCPQDCATPVCGNGICEIGEDAFNCPKDCAISVCGNGICESDENCLSCPIDCGKCEEEEPHRIIG